MKKKAQITPDKSGYIQVEAGTRRIYWEYFGQGEKEVVVMLNGVAMATPGWYRNLPELQPDYDVLLYDYFGQGKSSQEDEPYYIDRFSDYLIAIMDELNIERVHPVGVSYGGFIAAELGRLHQDRLHTLTLSGILLTRETHFQMYQDLSLLFYQSPEPAFDIYTHYMYEKMFGEAFAGKLYGEKMQRMRNGFYNAYHGIVSGRRTLQANAVEFLDNLLRSDVKKYILPILDEESTDTVLKTGQDVFQVRYQDVDDMLKHLITGNDNWLRACALLVAAERNSDELNTLIRGAVNDDDQLVSETAGLALQRSDL